MRVSRDGPFRTLPLRDQVKIVAVLPFALLASAVLAAVMALHTAAQAVLERLTR